MRSIPRARDDGQIRPQPANGGDNLINLGCGIDGDDNATRCTNPASLQKGRARGIAEEHFLSGTAGAGNRGRVVINRDLTQIMLAEQRSHGFAHAPVANNDGMALLRFRQGFKRRVLGLGFLQQGRQTPRKG